MILRHTLGLAVLSAALIGVAGCDRGSDTTTSNTTTTPPSGTTTPPAGTDMTNHGTADTQPATTGSNLPGLPSVNGTSVRGMSTADAAATRLIDEAKNAIAKNDTSKAKTLVEELKQKGMYDSLSAPVKSQVDELATQIGNAGPATQAQ